MEAICRVEGSLLKTGDSKYISMRLYHSDMILCISSHLTPLSSKANVKDLVCMHSEWPDTHRRRCKNLRTSECRISSP